MKKMTVTAVITGLAICALALVAKGEGDGLFSSILQRVITGMFTGDIYLSGRVTDTNGVALKDVTLEVELMDGRTYEKRLRRGTFEIEYRKCQGVNLHFSKAGYLSESRDYEVAFEELASNDEVRAYCETNIEIVLQSEGILAALSWQECQLWYALDGSAHVADLRLRYEDHDCYQVSNTTAVRPTVFLIEAETNAEMGIMSTEKGVPTNVWLRTGDPKGGLIQYFPRAKGAVVYQRGAVLSEMREAPETGYSNRMQLIPAETAFFYFHVTNLYGKGSVCAAWRKREERVYATIILRAQPEGQRNVASTY